MLEENWIGTTVFNELPDYIEEAIIPEKIEGGSSNRGGVSSLGLLRPLMMFTLLGIFTDVNLFYFL